MKSSSSKKKSQNRKNIGRGKNRSVAAPSPETGSPLAKRYSSRLPLLLAFFLPFAAALVIFALAEISPFGDKTILVQDGWKQYYPFFKAFREKLMTGGSLQYTRDVGMGTGYASLYAYYLASPLNWLCVLVPSSALLEFYALLTVVKIACAGLFFALFLKTVYRRNDLSIAFFALLYAFCSWTAGYYWNLMWLDTFALLPLLVAGTVCLLREGKYRLYVIALALSLWCNYYLAYFSCIFVLLTFLAYCITFWQGWRNLLRRFLRIGVCTLLAFGLTAVLLLPTLKAMQSSYASAGAMYGEWGLNLAGGETGLAGVWSASRTILSNLMPDPSVTEILPAGLPNIYCGFCAVVLAIYFCCCGKVSLREKLCSVFLLLFLLMSFIFRRLDYLWHGLHFPNGLPYRFSFLFSFVTIAMAYRAYTLMDSFKKWYLLIIVPVAGLLIWNAWDAEFGSVTAAIAVVCALVAAFLIHGRQKARRITASVIVFAVIAAEAISCFHFGVEQADYLSKTEYLKDEKEIQALLETAQTPDGFGRTELTVPQSRNDGALYGYRGASIFTSSANANFNRFSPALGLSSLPVFNWYLYWENSPFANTLCGVQYLLDCEGLYRDPVHNTLLATEENVNLLRNSYYISAGFMTDSDLSAFSESANTDDPIRDQNELFRLATGVQEPLYVSLPCEQLLSWNEGSSLVPYEGLDRYYSYSCVNASGRSTFSVFYRAPSDGLCYATTRLPNLSTVYVYINGQFRFDRYISSRGSFSLGRLSEGDEIQLVYFVDPGWYGYLYADVVQLDENALWQGWHALADEPWVLTKASDTELSGTVTALHDGLFYTSVPYEPGWTATVDGEEVALAQTFDPAAETVNLTDAVISFPLGAGTHEVTLRYRTPGLTAGALISAVSLLVFFALLYLRRKEKSLFPDPPAASEPR